MQQKLKVASNILFPLLGIVLITKANISNPKTTFTEITNNKAMNTTTLSTYLLLDGTCKQAMEFYKSCLGGELAMTTVGNSPMKSFFPESMHHKILNAKLVSGNINISASDWLRPNQTPVKGNTVCLYLSSGSYTEIKDLFDKLSDGADITDPLKNEPFGAYGALNDKFGNRWMFHSAATTRKE